MLLVQLPVGFRDGGGAQQAILASDAAIDDDVRDMHAGGTVLAGETLRD